MRTRKQTWQTFLLKYKLEQRRKLSETRLCFRVIKVPSQCFRFVLKRFCPLPGALRGELGNTSSKGDTVQARYNMASKREYRYRHDTI